MFPYCSRAAWASHKPCVGKWSPEVLENSRSLQWFCLASLKNTSINPPGLQHSKAAMNHLRKESTDFRSNAILHICRLSLKSRSIMKYQLATCFYSEHKINSMDSYSEIYNFIFLKKNTLQIPHLCPVAGVSVPSSPPQHQRLAWSHAIPWSFNQEYIVSSRVRGFMIFPENRPKSRKAKATCLVSTAPWCWWVEDFPYFIIPWLTRFSLFEANPKVRIHKQKTYGFLG